eukprot:3933270-Rhodomonas_salina.1
MPRLCYLASPTAIPAHGGPGDGGLDAIGAGSTGTARRRVQRQQRGHLGAVQRVAESEEGSDLSAAATVSASSRAESSSLPTSLAPLLPHPPTHLPPSRRGGLQVVVCSAWDRDRKRAARVAARVAAARLGRRRGDRGARGTGRHRQHIRQHGTVAWIIAYIDCTRNIRDAVRVVNNASLMPTVSLPRRWRVADALCRPAAHPGRGRDHGQYISAGRGG